MATIKLLSERIGETIMISCPLLGGGEIVEAKLHAVEPSGLWLETQKFCDLLHVERPDQKNVTPVLFLPFEQIHFVLSRTL